LGLYYWNNKVGSTRINSTTKGFMATKMASELLFGSKESKPLKEEVLLMQKLFGQGSAKLL